MISSMLGAAHVTNVHATAPYPLTESVHKASRIAGVIAGSLESCHLHSPTHLTYVFMADSTVLCISPNATIPENIEHTPSLNMLRSTRVLM